MQQLLPGLWTLRGLGVGRVYALADGDDITLIDGSIASAGPKIIAQLERAGFAAHKVRRILVTHCHGDHLGALPYLKRVTNAEIFVPEGERDTAEGRAPFGYPPLATLPLHLRLMQRTGPTSFEGVAVAGTLKEGDTIPNANGDLTVLSVPGHSRGHLAYWQPARRVLFCGDVVLNLGGLRPPFAAFTPDMAANDRAVAKLAALEPDLLCCGHGAPLHQAAAALAAYAATRA